VIVPAGLYYRAKRTFRSAALLYFGEPFPVEPVPLAQGEEPPAEPVRELTARIQQALAAVTLQAGQAEVHALVDRAQRIVSTQDETPATPPSLVDEFALGGASWRDTKSRGRSGRSDWQRSRRGSTVTKPHSRRPVSTRAS